MTSKFSTEKQDNGKWLLTEPDGLGKGKEIRIGYYDTEKLAETTRDELLFTEKLESDYEDWREEMIDKYARSFDERPDVSAAIDRIVGSYIS